jgi:hypothetical protein
MSKSLAQSKILKRVTSDKQDPATGHLDSEGILKIGVKPYLRRKRTLIRTIAHTSRGILRKLPPIQDSKRAPSAPDGAY